MTPSAKKQPKAGAPAHPTDAAWRTLTWTDLDEWAGAQAVARGRSYQRNGKVSDLRRAEEGGLLAWVHGRSRYATHVEIDPTKRRRADRLDARCSCPVGVACKHAVAVVVAHLESLDLGPPTPEASPDDPRMSVIAGGRLEIDVDDWEVAPRSHSSTPRPRPKRITDDDLRAHLASKSSEDLITLVMQATARDAELRTSLVDECALAGGRFAELLAETRAEMRAVTAEEAWYSGWTGAGNLPDYSQLEQRLKTLVEHGLANEVLEIGDELMLRGIEQIEQSNDDGETSYEIAGCMDVVYEALLKSSRRDEDKIVDAIEKMLADDYGLCRSFAAVMDQRWPESTWSAVADRLRERLRASAPAPGREGERTRTYFRSQLAGWVVAALDKAGRTAEATELCIAQARATNDYPGAVRRLIAAGEGERAAALAIEGIGATNPQDHGIVHTLQDLLADIAASAGDWVPTASNAAERLFQLPSLERYRSLIEAARKTEHAKVIEESALAFLETGVRPEPTPPGRAAKRGERRWPIPGPPLPNARSRVPTPTHHGPHFDVLIQLAIAEQRPADALDWYDKRNAVAPFDHLGRRTLYDGAAALARAVEMTHPERAAELYLSLAESVAEERKPKQYPVAGAFIKRAESMLKQAGREDESAALIEDFRSRHRAKRRLMEVLDGLDGKPIVRRRRR